MTNQEIAQTIVPKIKKEMEERGLSIQQLSEITDVPYQTIWSILNSKAGLPSLDNLFKLLDGLDIPVSRFFEESEDLVYRLSAGEIIVVEMMRRMTSSQREALVNLVKQFQ